jgi:hypothetical protein
MRNVQNTHFLDFPAIPFTRPCRHSSAKHELARANRVSGEPNRFPRRSRSTETSDIQGRGSLLLRWVPSRHGSPQRHALGYSAEVLYPTKYISIHFEWSTATFPPFSLCCLDRPASMYKRPPNMNLFGGNDEKFV